MFKRWLQTTTMATMVALAPLSLMAQETPKQGGDIVAGIRWQPEQPPASSPPPEGIE